MQLAHMNTGDEKIDPKQLMALMGGPLGGDSKIASMMIQREEQISQRRDEIKRKKEEIERMRMQAEAEGKTEIVDEEAEKLELELRKQQAILKAEDEQKKAILDQLGELEGKMVVGEKEKEKVEQKRSELEKAKLVVEKELQAHDQVEKIFLQEEKKKEKLEKRNKTLTSQLNKIERDMANNNKELAKLSANISEFKATAARQTDELNREKMRLKHNLLIQESIIRALVPHSAEKIITSMVSWNEETQNWEIDQQKRMKPRFQRPFSIHGIKKPIAPCKKYLLKPKN